MSCIDCKYVDTISSGCKGCFKYSKWVAKPDLDILTKEDIQILKEIIKEYKAR